MNITSKYNLYIGDPTVTTKQGSTKLPLLETPTKTRTIFDLTAH